MAKVKYDDAIKTRQAQNTAQAGPQRSIMENVADIWSGLRDKASEYADNVAPVNPEERIQNGVANKVSSDTLKARAGYVGEHLGAKLHNVAGSAVAGAWSFLKASAGRSNNAVAGRLAEIDGTAKDDSEDTTTSNQ
jgi:hypothetical protein